MRVVIDVRETGASGHEVAAALARRFNTHVELATHAVIVLVLGVNEPPAPLARFAEQLAAVVDDLPSGAAGGVARAPAPLAGEPALSPREAWLAESERVDIKAAVGRISAEAIAGYPPGIPTLLPGERVTDAIVAYLRELVQVGVKLHGASDPHFETLAVVVEAGA
jgi:lysine decarboxylase